MSGALDFVNHERESFGILFFFICTLRWIFGSRKWFIGDDVLDNVVEPKSMHARIRTRHDQYTISSFPIWKGLVGVTNWSDTCEIPGITASF